MQKIGLFFNSDTGVTEEMGKNFKMNLPLFLVLWLLS